MNSNLKCDLHLTASYISDQSWKPSITAKDPSVPRYSRSEQSESIQSVVWSKQSPCYWQLSWGISVLFNNKSFCFCSFEEPHFILSFFKHRLFSGLWFITYEEICTAGCLPVCKQERDNQRRRKQLLLTPFKLTKQSLQSHEEAATPIRAAELY